MAKFNVKKGRFVAVLMASCGLIACNDKSSNSGSSSKADTSGVVAEVSPGEQVTLNSTPLPNTTTVQVGSSDMQLSQDTAFAYVRRSVASNATNSLSNYREQLANTSAGPLDLSTPYDVNMGAKLFVRSSLDVDAVDVDLLSDYFGSENYDVKDINVSADGKKLLFAAHGPETDFRNTTWNIFEYNFVTGSLRRVIADDEVANQGQDTSPTYAPDGSIVFSSDRSAGNPNSPVVNIVEPDSECIKVTPAEKPSLLHSMTSAGSDILQLTYGANHDTQTTTLKDGRIGFVRWSRSYDLVPQCATTSGSADLFAGTYPSGLNTPAEWSQDAICAYAFETAMGPVVSSNHYTVLRITADGSELEQLYETVTVSASDEEFLRLNELVQGENGQLAALLKHEYNPYSGGNLVELQSPGANTNTVFSEVAPASLTSKPADLYPNQLSPNGWYSALWPYRDGTSRYLISWSQCTVTTNGISSFCKSGQEGEANVRYGIWVYDPSSDTRLPIVRAKADVVYTEVAMAQPHNGVDFPYQPHNPEFVDDMDLSRIVCPDPTPIEPEEPTTEPETPVEPEEPTTEPETPVEPEEPTTEPETPVEPEEPTTEPETPVEPEEPTTEPETPVEPEEPTTEPETPVEPEEPTTEPETPVEPEEPTTEPETPVEPEEPTTEPETPIEPEEPTTEPETPVEPEEPTTEPETPVEPEEPTTEPETPVEPEEPTTEPETPVEPENRAPIANAGADRPVFLAGSIVLDGSASTDADGDSLTYHWTILPLAEGLMANLSDPTAIMPTLEFVGYGDYVVQLIVNDGELDSEPDTVVITSGNTAPVADAGDDRSTLVGELMVLDGSASSDADGDSLAYSWSLIEQPEDSAAVLDSAATVSPMLQIDVAGTYVVELLVNDGELSDSDQVVITTLNTKPVANAGENVEAERNALVALDGTGSYDADGDELTYAWNLISVPADSTAYLNDNASSSPSLTTDVAGTYVAQLIVNDGTVDSNADTVSIFVEEPPAVCDTSRISRRSIPFVLRDFKSSHPDFEYKIADDFGLVKDDLGEDGKPVYNGHPTRGTDTTHGRDTFNQWYNTVDGVNKEISLNLELKKVESTGYWEYVNSSFFPLDGLGFGNTRGTAHNYHFTLETHLEFAYEGGEEFTFRGDDDLFLFINGKLAIDIGGVHGVLERTVKLDEIAVYLGIVPGNTYSFDLFFAERHTVESNFMFQTNMNLECSSSDDDEESAPEAMKMTGGGTLSDGNFGFNVLNTKSKGNIVHLLYNNRRFSQYGSKQIKINTSRVNVTATEDGVEFSAPCRVRDFDSGKERTDNLCKVTANDSATGDQFSIEVVDGPHKGFSSGGSLSGGNITRHRR